MIGNDFCVVSTVVGKISNSFRTAIEDLFQALVQVPFELSICDKLINFFLSLNHVVTL